MMARKKALTVVEPATENAATQDVKFERPAPKGEVTLVDAANLDQLIDLLHNDVCYIRLNI